MNTAKFQESIYIPASPETVYQLLADYRVGHPSILPKPYFADLRVVEGGYGDGTLIEVDMEVFGVKRSMRMQVSEPEPGHILAEKDVDTGTETEFIFEAQGEGCSLTIRTKMNFADGLGGYLEKLTTPMITRRIYRMELQNIVAHLQEAEMKIA